MLQNGLDPGGDQLGGFDPGVLDIDQPHGDIHRLGQLCQQLDLCQLATGELQRKLVHGNPTDVWKERPVRAVPHGTTAIIAEAHVHADVGKHPPNGAGNHIEEMVGRVGMAGEARFVKLDEIDARRHEGHELGVDDRNQGLGRGVAIGVDLAPLDAASQCERPGNRCLYRPPGIFPEPVVFGDSSQTVGSRQRLQAAVPLTLVMRRGAPVAYTTNWLEAQGLRTTFSGLTHHFFLRF